MGIEFGATLRTPDGKVGTVLQEGTHGTVRYFDRSGGGSRRVEVYAVLLESGEVRLFSERALLDANDMIRRSSSLK